MAQANRPSLLTPPHKTFHKKLARGCPRFLMKKCHQKKSSSVQTAHPRVSCDIAGCTSSFSRLSDMIRHKKTVHGPKQQCVYHDCQHATGRVDKMNEHVRNIHKNIDSQDSTSHNNPPSTDSVYHTQALDELDRAGRGWEADLSTLLTGGVDCMAQSWDIMKFAEDFDASFDVFGAFLTNEPAPLNCYN